VEGECSNLPHEFEWPKSGLGLATCGAPVRLSVRSSSSRP
jgi:hypothetical protein